MGSQICHPCSIGGSAPIQDQTRVFSLLGSLPAYLGRCHQFRPLDAILHFFTYSGWKIYQVDVVEEVYIRFLMKFHGGVDVQWFKPYICAFFAFFRHFWSVFNDSKWQIYLLGSQNISILYTKRQWGINYVILKNLHPAMAGASGTNKPSQIKRDHKI